MKEIYFLKPLFFEKIWGGTRLEKNFGYHIPEDIDKHKVGEAWGISGHYKGRNTIINGKYKGMNLDDLWKTHPEIFGEDGSRGDFPLQLRLVDAQDDLSIQVHPYEEYAMKHENQHGKNEAWYIIECQPDSKLIYGSNANTKDELKQMVAEGRWNDLVRYKNIKAGDFVYVPSGMLHAICAGTMVLEIAQCSDVTYRFYDYDRVDKNGNHRPLHIKKSIDVLTVPTPNVSLNKKVIKYPHSTKEIYLDNEFFYIAKITVNGAHNIKNDKPFGACCVLNGSGKIMDYEIKKGDFFIVPSDIKTMNIEGNLEMIIACA